MRPVTQTIQVRIEVNATHVAQPNPERSQITVQKPEHVTIISRSFLSNGDVRFVVRVRFEHSSREHSVSLDELLLRFVSLQQLHDFENGQFTRAAEEHNSKPRHKRRSHRERSGVSVARYLEGHTAGSHGGVNAATTSSVQGPLDRAGVIASIRGGSDTPEETDRDDERMSDTIDTPTPITEDTMSDVGIHDGHHLGTTADQSNPQHRNNTLKERSARPKTVDQSRVKPNSSLLESDGSDTIQASSNSAQYHSINHKDENEISERDVLLRQFQGGQTLGLDQDTISE